MIYFSVISSRGSKEWSDHVDVCKETWATTLRQEDSLYFIFGDHTKEELQEDFLTIEGSTDVDEIHYSIADSYHKVLFKTVLNMRDFLRTDHQFYVRTHTGSYLHLGLMHDICTRLPTTKAYAGFHGFDPITSTHFASGACFVMSRDIVEKIVVDFSIYQPTLGILLSYDDVAFGSIVTKSLGVPLIELPRITIQDELLFHPEIAHYYFTRESGKKPEYHRIIHREFCSIGKK